MLHKKPTFEEPEKSPEEKELEERIDAMMDISRKEGAPDEAPEVDDSAAPIDIFADQKTAPELDKKADDVPKEKLVVMPDSPESEEPEPANGPVAAEEPEAQAATEQAADSSPAAPSDDAETSKAVDDITHAESDALLKAEDDKVKRAAAPKPKTRWQKIKGFFAAWWANKWARRATIAVLVLVIIGSVLWPTSRYFVLNTVGVRSTASLRVVDSATGLPLRNVEVALGGASALSERDGSVLLQRVKLGRQELKVERVAFAVQTRHLTVGWGSNPLGDFELEATGVRYVFEAADFLSGKPVTTAEATSGQANALADENGVVTLTVEDPGTDTITVTIEAEEYRAEPLTFDVRQQGRIAARLVPAQPVVFISKQSGTYDLYRVDADGKNRKVLVEGISNDDLQSRHEMNLLVRPDGAMAAVVSKRENRRDTTGYLLDTLTLIDLETGDTAAVDYGQQLRLLGWTGRRLTYVATYAGPSAATDGRQRVVSYDSEEASRQMIAKADYFRGLMFVRGQLFYSVHGFTDGSPRVVRINADGSGEKTLLKERVWSVMRVSATELAFESQHGVKRYDLETERITDATRADARYFNDGSRGRSIWVDERDGKGVLLLHDAKSDQDNLLASAAGISPPVQWLNSTTAAYAVVTSGETAIYAVSTEGGNPVKVTDATIPAVMIYDY